jgi:hypothetical protein
LARDANFDGLFVLVLQAAFRPNSMKKLIEIVDDLLLQPIQLRSFLVLFEVNSARMK